MPAYGWELVDDYLNDALVSEDEPLRSARHSSAETTMPYAGVAPNQGKLLSLLVQIAGAKRVLEFGALAGYSTIWLARAVGEDGHLTTLESDSTNAAVALRNVAHAGLSGRVDVIVGPAAESAAKLIEDGTDPFDLFFIDADKQRTPDYLELCLRLARPGSVIIADNVVRDGHVADPHSSHPGVQGIRSFFERVAAHPQLDATAIQTVGAKGWDGFALVRVRESPA